MKHHTLLKQPLLHLVETPEYYPSEMMDTSTKYGLNGLLIYYYLKPQRTNAAPTCDGISNQ